MTFPYGLSEKQTKSLIESTSVAGQAAVAVCNPDGTNISGGGGVADMNLAEVGGAAIALGQALATASLPVVLTAAQITTLTPPAVASNAGNTSATTQRVIEAGSSTGTSSSVVSSATNVTIFAANASRLGATVFNESTQILYLKLGATASATSYSAQIAPSGYYEVPFKYSGIIDGIWASANGNARITELT